MMFWMAYGGGLVRQRVPLHAWLKSIEFWAITVFLILLGGSVGAFERQLSRRRVPDGGRFIERKSELRCRFQLIRRLDGAYSNTLLSLAVARARSHLLANA